MQAASREGEAGERGREVAMEAVKMTHLKIDSQRRGPRARVSKPASLEGPSLHPWRFEPLRSSHVDQAKVLIGIEAKLGHRSFELVVRTSLFAE